MRVLQRVAATAEQLTIIEDASPGFWLVRGAAGSGKTTTALLRLNFLMRFWRERSIDLGLGTPVRVLVLTFNRTLRGYIEELTRHQVGDTTSIDLTISTFAKWAMGVSGLPYRRFNKDRTIKNLGRRIPLDPAFLLDEVDYALGRFLPNGIDEYVTARRQGRGQAPRVDGELRQRLLDEVIRPYTSWKRDNGFYDWNDFAVAAATNPCMWPYDVVIVDEAQDFSANQIRAVRNHLSEDHVTTFIRDTVQRIYPSAFTWREVGIEIPTAHNKPLTVNHRNSRQIAAFARPLVDGLDGDPDATLPDFKQATFDGRRKPEIVRGGFAAQLEHALKVIAEAVGPDESVAFLHPLGWFDYLREQLDNAGLAYAKITRESEWPQGAETIALSTMHSAKGLEFDHVFLLGLNGEVLSGVADALDARSDNDRRLVAMAVGRARQIVVVGFKPEDPPGILGFLRDGTYELVDL